jgi:hypothetical protein
MSDLEKDELEIIWDRIKLESEANKQVVIFEEQKPSACNGITSDDVIRIFPGARIQAQA